jgi:hypothetical protein
MSERNSQFLIDLAEELRGQAQQAQTRVSTVREIAAETGDPEILKLSDDLNKKAAEFWETCYEAYKQAEREGQLEPQVHRSLGTVLLAMNRWDDAYKEFEASAVVKRAWRRQVVDAALDYVSSLQTYSYTKDWLKRQLEGCRKKEDKLGSYDALSAMFMLVRERYGKIGRHEGFVPDPAPSPRGPLMVTPLAIEADNTLFPSDDNWEQTHPLFQQYVPEMRKRILRNIGVQVPGIRFRGNDTDLENRYIIIVNEVPLAIGTVDRQRKFCSNYDAAGLIPDDGAEPDTSIFNPLNGENDGAWIEDKYSNDYRRPGPRLLNYFEYMVYHLERVLLSDLTPFLGTQEVHNLLAPSQTDNTDGEPEFEELVQKTISNPTVTNRFLQVLRGLVREAVPITRLPALLKSFHEQPATADVIKLVESARQTIKDQLPGNNASLEFLGPSDKFENEIQRYVAKVDGKAFLQIPPQEAQKMLAQVRSAIGDRKQSALAVVTRASTRPAFRRLIELEFPRVAVLSFKELCVDWPVRISEIEY